MTQPLHEEIQGLKECVADRDRIIERQRTALTEVSAQLAVAVEAIQRFSDKHSSGHTMGWGPCAGCDLIAALQKIRGGV